MQQWKIYISKCTTKHQTFLKEKYPQNTGLALPGSVFWNTNPVQSIGCSESQYTITAAATQQSID
jgi:hypothetical protein